VYEASNPREAVALLRKYDIPVAIADGGWRDIIDSVASRANPPSVIVTSSFADEALWAEVLNLGGFDVLAQPFDANEVARIAQAALRRSKMPAHHAAGRAHLAAAM
jgi:DNA-binding response OmpR family regulator